MFCVRFARIKLLLLMPLYTFVDKAERSRKASVMVNVICRKEDFDFGLHGQKWGWSLLSAIASSNRS